MGVSYGTPSSLSALLSAADTVLSPWPGPLARQFVAFDPKIGTALMPNPTVIPGTLQLAGTPPINIPGATAGMVLTSDAFGNFTPQAGTGTLPFVIVPPSGDSTGAQDIVNLLAAFAAVSNAGTVWLLPNSTYYIGAAGLSVPPYVKLWGGDPQSTIINCVGGGTGTYVQQSNPANPTTYTRLSGGVHDVIIDGTGAGNGAIGYQMLDMNGSDIRVAVRNFTGAGSSPPTGLAAAAVGSGGTFAPNTYFWKITALWGGGETLASNEATATIVLNGEANLSWTALSGASGYKIYRGTSSGNETTLVATGITGTAYTDTGSSLAGNSPVPIINTSGSTGIQLANNTHSLNLITGFGRVENCTNGLSFTTYGSQTALEHIYVVWTIVANANQNPIVLGNSAGVQGSILPITIGPDPASGPMFVLGSGCVFSDCDFLVKAELTTNGTGTSTISFNGSQSGFTRTTGILFFSSNFGSGTPPGLSNIVAQNGKLSHSGIIVNDSTLSGAATIPATAVGAVTGVTAGDASMSVGGTTLAPTVTAGTLDQVANLHPPAANWSNNSKKITNLANGSAATDAAAFGQIMALQAATAVAGYTLVNGTGNIITWTAPSDGQQHRFLVLGSQDVTVVEVGGQIQLNITLPDGAVNGQNFFGPNGAVGTRIQNLGGIVEAGTTVTIKQNSALTSGTAVMWAEIWAS